MKIHNNISGGSKDADNGNTHTLLLGMWTMEISMEIPQKNPKK